MAAEQRGTTPLPDIVELLRRATGEDHRWARGLTADSRLADDVGLESVEVTALAALLRQRYGPEADLPAYLAELELDELLALTVGDLQRWLARWSAAARQRADTAARRSE